MLGAFTGALERFGGLSEPIGWLVLTLFLTAIALEYVDRERARYVLLAAWSVFAVFWLAMVYPWLVIDDSVIKGVGALVAAPLSLLVAKSLSEGRDSLFTLSRAIAFMGLFYAPIVMIPVLRQTLVEIVTNQTAWGMSLLGYDPPLVTELSEVSHLPEVDAGDEVANKETDYRNTFVFPQPDGGRITYSIIIACTGVGSMAVIFGLITAVRAPLRRKAKSLALALPIIYVLNIVRNVFIAISFGRQKMNVAPEATMWLFGLDKELYVSYIWADRVLAQSGSVIAMILIFWLVVRIIPEVMQPVEEVLYLLTGDEYDLAEALNVEVADGTDIEPAD